MRMRIRRAAEPEAQPFSIPHFFPERNSAIVHNSAGFFGELFPGISTADASFFLTLEFGYGIMVYSELMFAV